ncbi:MAG: hypothetical protein IJ193_05745 [Bacilli bacterium]|nr:hypothetical protein [Bacilli bacterium]
MDKKEYMDMMNKMKSCTDQSIGFLQQFYSIHMINEMIPKDSTVREEWNSFMKRELAELYASDSAASLNESLGGFLEKKENIPTVTVALIESCFPEFLDGDAKFSFEQRQIAATMISSSKNYFDTSAYLKAEIMSSLMRENKTRVTEEVPFIGDLSKGKVISLRSPIEQYR